MKKSELKQIIQEEIQKVLNEENEDISTLAKILYKGGVDSEEKTKAAVEAKLGRKLTVIEKTKVTKVVNKIDNEKVVVTYEKRKKKESEGWRKRYEQGLLPLELDDFHGTPDPRYYESKKIDSKRIGYRRNPSLVGYLDIYQSISRPEPSSVTKFELKDKYINTPITGPIKVGKENWTLEKIYKEFYGLKF